MRRAQAIRERLGATRNLCLPFPDKPKGMHWQTYFRLFREHQEADGASLPGWLLRKAEKKLAMA